ncbi:MAG: hypothetical protein KGH96_22040, partial [Sphingomonadales bacterium]|nr:hypothetical protein [Sphingomonadales bacterium]
MLRDDIGDTTGIVKLVERRPAIENFEIVSLGIGLEPCRYVLNALGRALDGAFLNGLDLGLVAAGP